MTQPEGLASELVVSGEAEVIRGPHHAADCRCDELDTGNCVKNEEEGADR